MFVSHIAVTVGNVFAHKNIPDFWLLGERVPGEVCVFCLAAFINRKCIKTFMAEIVFTLF